MLSKKKFRELVEKGLALKRKLKEIKIAYEAIQDEALKVLKKDGFTCRQEGTVKALLIQKYETIWHVDVIEEALKGTPYYDKVFPRVFNVTVFKELVSEGLIAVRGCKEKKLKCEYVDFKEVKNK